MTLTEDIATVGIGLMVISIALLGSTRLRAAKRRAENERQLGDAYPGLFVDMYMALFWSGMLVLQIANILLHAEPGGTYRVDQLMLIATAAIVFICGAYAGRLTMRLEMRAYKAKRAREARS